MALGFNLDLLPTVLSAANGRLGYAPQVCYNPFPLQAEVSMKIGWFVPI
jgi:hypothetical protein